MIERHKIEDSLQNALQGTDIFPVDVKITPDNTIVIELDSDSAMDIETCARVTRAIEADFDREIEDYSLEVGSAGLTAPLKLPRQYSKYIGKDLDILTTDGRKFTARLTDVTPENITVEVSRKVKEPGAKRPAIVAQPETIAYADIKRATYRIDFK